MKKEIFGFDAFSPSEIADRIESVGVIKARLPLIPMAMLGILAGAFIGFGAMLFTLVSSDMSLGFAASRLIGGLVFSLGLILVVIAGAELFTGNNLLSMAWVEGKVSLAEVLKNWIIVCFSNFAGATLLVMFVFLSGHTEMNHHAVAEKYLQIASAKCSLSFTSAFFSGVLCNMLVCLAVWMTFAGRTVTDKILAIVFPVTAFVAAGFEHSVANMFFIPMGILLKTLLVSETGYEMVSWQGFLKNIIPVIAGNIVGGSVFVAIVYSVIYKSGKK